LNAELLRRGAGRRLGACACLLLAITGFHACSSSAPPASALALWNLVEAGCNQGQAPVASLQCNPTRHDAVLKDRCGSTHFLLIATARRAGIESAELLRDDEPDYFADAWAARDRVIAASGRADVSSAELALAINSRWGRSQEQLHIHIDLVNPSVRETLQQWSGDAASRPTVELFGHTYRITHIASLQLPTPFQRVLVAGASAWQRGRETIAVVGDGHSGFYLLAGRADLLRLDRGHAEEVLVPRHCR
jgi:CDP-diacylglycerol pyrophosphatase